MSGRTYAVIFFFWAALTIITPTLIFLSETSKPYLESNGEKTEGIKARRMIGIIGYETQRRIALPTTEAAAPAPVPAPTPTPVSKLKPALEPGENSFAKSILESLRLVLNNTKFNLT